MLRTLCFPLQEAWVWSLVGELRSGKLCGAAEKKAYNSVVLTQRQNRAAVATVNFRTVHLPQRNPMLISSHYNFFSTLPALGHHKFAFCPHRFVYYRHFLQKESYGIWYIVTGFFDLAQCSFILSHVSVLHFFLLLNHSALCGWTMF